MDNQEEKQRHRVGTIQGVAFILSVLSLIILLQIYPNLNRNVEETSEMIAELENKISEADLRLNQLSKRICTTRFDSEITSLNRIMDVLDDVSEKASDDASLQAKEIQGKIQQLIAQLKTETISSAISSGDTN